MAINPKGITEQMMYSTVLIQASQGTGTGYFFIFKDGEVNYPVIITNKHVVNYNKNEKVRLKLHTWDGKENIDSQKIDLEWNSQWIFHPTYDLCCLPLVPIIKFVHDQTSKKILYIPLDESMIWSDERLLELDTVEEVLMVGYPIGLWDQKNNYPLFRKGITASHPSVDFNGKSEAVIDIASFPGSSGSPVFIYNMGSFANKTNKGINIGGRLIFLGTLYAGPYWDATGTIKVTQIPTNNRIQSNTPIMINLGYYIKARELYELKKILIELDRPPQG